MSEPRLPAAGFTGIGSLPGEDIDAAVAIAFDQSPDLPWLPELPARGPGSDMIGRTLAALDLAAGIGFDLQPAGWRLVARGGLDARRATDRLTADIDALMLFADFDGVVKVQLTGPWTLAAGVELPRGGRALRDAGAVRDLAAGLAEAVPAHLAEVRRRLPSADLVIQLDEPGLPAVVDGAIPTLSGISRIAAVEPSDAVDVLGQVIAAAGVPAVVHCCAPDPPLELAADAGAAAVAWDATALSADGRLDEDIVGGLVERGVQLWLGVLPGLGPGAAPAPRTVADPVRRLWRSLGFAPERLTESVVLTASCGLAGASSGWVNESFRVLRQAARALSEAPEIMRR